jgi:polyisoprenyl-phosphate glycosyltransferase
MDEKEPLGLSIIIPIYNEHGNIRKLISKIESFSKFFNDNHEFIIVDGCSDDGSIELLKNINYSKNLKILFQNKKKGYGYDILKGLEISKYNYIGWTHADMQTDINDLEKAYKLIIKENNILVKGKRRNRKIVESLLTYGMEIFVLFILRKKLNDINAQPKVFERNFFNNINNKSWPDDFSLDLYLLLQAKRMNITIKSIDVFFHKRLHGIAKGGGGIFSKFKLIKRTIDYIIKISKLSEK